MGDNMEQMSATGLEFGMLESHGRRPEPLELKDALSGFVPVSISIPLLFLWSGSICYKQEFFIF